MLPNLEMAAIAPMTHRATDACLPARGSVCQVTCGRVNHAMCSRGFRWNGLCGIPVVFPEVAVHDGAKARIRLPRRNFHWAPFCFRRRPMRFLQALQSSHCRCPLLLHKGSRASSLSITPTISCLCLGFTGHILTIRLRVPRDG